MTDKDLLKRRIDTYNNLISRLDRITSANYMHIVAGMRCTLRAMIDNNLAIIDSTQENPCEGCTNRKGCVTCENGELKETELSHSEVTKISDQEMPVSDDLEEAARNAATWHSRTKGDVFIANDYYKFIAGAQWQKQQIREEINLLKEWFEDISEKCEHLTSGNVSHNGKMIRGFAKNCAEYIETDLL